MKRRIFWKKFLVCMILFFWTPFLCGLLFWKMEVKKAPKWEQNTENIRDFQVVPKRLAGFETSVRDGNRWNLSVITTGKRLVFTNDCILSRFHCAVKRG